MGGDPVARELTDRPPGTGLWSGPPARPDGRVSGHNLEFHGTPPKSPRFPFVQNNDQVCSCRNQRYKVDIPRHLMRSRRSRAHFIFPCSRATAFESDNGRSALVTGTALPAPQPTFEAASTTDQVGWGAVLAKTPLEFCAHP